MGNRDPSAPLPIADCPLPPSEARSPCNSSSRRSRKRFARRCAGSSIRSCPPAGRGAVRTASATTMPPGSSPASSRATWPKDFGGLDADHMTQLIYNEEMAYHRAPGGGGMGVAWVGPAVMLYGTQEQKDRYLPRITSGEDVWC